MNHTQPKLLVLDGQGVVFDAPFQRFLRSFARDNDVDDGAVIGRWEAGLRLEAWTGSIDDAALWNALAGKRVSLSRTMASLSATYRPGPVATYLSTWSELVPIWLLSNHRSNWLLPRLDEMNLARRFQRLLISDKTGVVKPDPNAFQQPIAEAPADQVLFVDDQAHNTAVAEKLGLSAIHASPARDWVTEVDRRLRCAMPLEGVSGG
ncbi:MAG: hypothetical protein AAF417_04370 [Pseudomonadota bacterium]